MGEEQRRAQSIGGESCHLRLILHPPPPQPHPLPASFAPFHPAPWGRNSLSLRHRSLFAIPPPPKKKISLCRLLPPFPLSLEKGKQGKLGRCVGGVVRRGEKWGAGGPVGSMSSEWEAVAIIKDGWGAGEGGGWKTRSLHISLPASFPPSPTVSLLTISIRLHFLLKANSVVLGLRWMAALELRFNQ